MQTQRPQLLKKYVLELLPRKERKLFKRAFLKTLRHNCTQACNVAPVLPFESIPGPRGLPYLGTLFQYTSGALSIDRYHENLVSNYRKYGKIFKETIAGQTVVHLFDPDYVKKVYMEEGKIPHIPPLLETTQLYREYRGLSPGLGNTNGDEWYRLRSAVQQMMMRPKAVATYLPFTNAIANEFLARIDKVKQADDTVENFMNEIYKWTLESSAMNCFQFRMGCLEADSDSHQQRMIDASSAIFALSLKLKFSIPWFKLFPTKTWKQLLEAEDYFFQCIFASRNGQNMTDETVARINEKVQNGTLMEDDFPFLGYLLGKKELSYKDVSIITLSLFSDGLSTTSPTMAGQIYCLASNPEAQEKARDEVLNVVGDSETITADMLGRLPYLKACVKEGFRFFPIGTEVSRLPQKDLVIGGYHIPAGTHVELNNNMLLRLEEYFSEPESYIPERWVRGSDHVSVHPFLLIPFGHGPRMCAGRRFAEQEMFVMLAKLLQRYRMSWARDAPLKQAYCMLLKPHMEPRFRFEDLV